MPAHHPPRPGRLPAGERSSIKMALAASLLRRGHNPLHVAERTHLPLALVELLAEHTTRAPATPSAVPAEQAATKAAAAGQTDPSAGAGTRPGAPRHPAQARPARIPATTSRTNSRRWLVTASLPLAVNLAIAVFAATTHHPALAAATLIMALPLFGYTTLIALTPFPPPRRRPHH